jgi:hypothetical protein
MRGGAGGGEHLSFQGEMCLLGAMNHFRKQERLKGDRTRLYLMRAIRQEGFKATGVMDFNDGPRRYSDITRVLRRARELVLQEERRTR